MITKEARPLLVDLINNDHAQSSLFFTEELNQASNDLMIMIENAFKHENTGMLIAHKGVSASKQAIEKIATLSRTYLRDMIVLDVDNILTGNPEHQTVHYNPLGGKSLLQALRMICSVFMETEKDETERHDIIRKVLPLLKKQIKGTTPHLTLRKLFDETKKLGESDLDLASQNAIEGLLNAFAIINENDLIDRLTDSTKNESFNFSQIILNNKIGVIKNSCASHEKNFNCLQLLASADLLETMVEILDESADKGLPTFSHRRYFFADLSTLFSQTVMPLIARYSRKLNMQSHLFLDYNSLPISPNGDLEVTLIQSVFNRIYYPTNNPFSYNVNSIGEIKNIGKKDYMRSLLDPDIIYKQKIPLDTVLFCSNSLQSPKLVAIKEYSGRSL